MTNRISTHEETSLAATVAPEDLKCGQFVAVLNKVVEFPSYLWCDSVPTARDEPIRLRYFCSCGGIPLRIVAICLPFVFVKSPYGQSCTLDVREYQLVRLKKRYAKIVWKNLREHRVKKKKQKKL